MNAQIYDIRGKEAGTIALDPKVWGLKFNRDLVHQVVTTILTARRTPVAHTKTRGEVRGGGRKPWKQKGTGQARHGSRRSPIWVGGGVAHGPRNEKNFDRKVNKKVKAKALFTVLSKKLADGEVLFVNSLSFKEPKTKEAKAVLAQLSTIKGFEKLSLKRKNAAYLALDTRDANTFKSFANFSNLIVDEARNMNIVDLLNKKFVIITNPEVSLKALSSKIN
jgi:large subunit ribosomal protein L4